MHPPAVRRWIAVVTVAASAALYAADAGAAPVGLIREIPIHSNVGGIAAGPEGNLWFTQNAAVGRPHEFAIGRITPGGRVTRFKAGLTGATEPLGIVAGPDGNLWFTYAPGFTATSGGGVGRVTPGGEIALFPEPPGLHGSPFEIVAGPDGNLWFGHAAILTPSGQAIGRITPAGEIAEFSVGLRESASVTNLTAGPGGVWFGDNSSTPAIGRISPTGEITEFAGIPPREYPILEGPTPGAEGNLWFSANEPRTLVERITPGGAIERFGAGLDPRAEYVGPFATGADGNAWFRVQKRPPRHRPRSEAGLTAIGRITPSGRITEFDRCLRPMPDFAGPNFLTLGPDGNVWFTTWESGDGIHTTRSSTPSIGRVTPNGRITEFRLGLHRESQPESLVASGGRLWFIDRETESIGTVAPSPAPANTFLLLSPHAKRGTDVTRIPVVVPGPGELTLRQLGAGGRAVTVKARGCGPTTLSLVPRGLTRKRLLRRGSLPVGVRITFKPRGGSAFSQRTTVVLRSAGDARHRRAGRQVRKRG
jgi:streptogramin lyase